MKTSAHTFKSLHWLAVALVLPAMALALATHAWAGKASHAHVRHVSEGWADTPSKVGLIQILRSEAEVADAHAGFAVRKTGDLKWMQMHVRHVRHALDAGTEAGGPGKGYGVVRAAAGAAKHIGFAAAANDSSAGVKLHAVHVSTSLGNVGVWSREALQLSEAVLSASTAAEAAAPMRQIKGLTRQIMEGAGGKSWKKGEGGLAQAQAHMGFLIKGEKM